jgi:ankyrin repeat protein
VTGPTFTWQSSGKLPGDDDIEHTATIDGTLVRWATITDAYDDDTPYTGGSEETQPLADFLANGPIQHAPVNVLDEMVQAVGKPAAWFEPLRLQIAAREGDLTAIKGLLRLAGAHKNTVVRGATPLSAALEGEHVEVAKLLVQGGCDPNVRLAGGVTALHVAARNAKTAASADVLRDLLAAGADIEAQTDEKQTPLVAGLSGHLCKEGVQVLVEQGKAINVASADGTTPLLAEARGWCRPSVVRLLLGAGADVNARSADGWSALLWAISKHDLWLVKMLVDAGADVNVVGQAHKQGQAPRSALALAEGLAASARQAEAGAATGQAAIKKKSSELAGQIVDALRAAGAT